MAVGSTSLNLILDDNSGAFQYGPFAWTSTQLSQYYGSKMMLPAFAAGVTEDSSNTSPYGSFSVTFEGISIAFVGTTPALASSQTILVSIDGGTPYETSYDDSTPPSYMQWYQSPMLAEGIHSVVVDQLAGTSIDYAIVTVGPNTPLTGMQVIVDNEDPSIQWSSGWALNTDQFDSAFLPDGFAYQNSTRRSSAAGDAMAFRFQGTSVSIYGIFSWFNTGMISATFTLDDETIPQTYYATPDDTALNQGDAQNYLFMSYDNLLPQDHTLIINVTRCINQTFILDYITYMPSFSTLAEKDNLSPPAVQPSSPTISSIPTSIQPSSVSATSVGPSTLTIALPSVTSLAGESSVANKAQSKGIPVAAIVSVAITLFLFIVALLFLCARARRSGKKFIEEPSPSAFPLLQITAFKERRPYSGVPNRNQTYSPSGNVKMMPFPGYRQAELENSEITDRKQDKYNHWLNRRNDVSSRTTNETTNMPSSSRQQALAPLRRIPTDSSSEPSTPRRGIHSRPPPAYSATITRMPTTSITI